MDGDVDGDVEEEGEWLLELQQGHSFQYVVQLAPVCGLLSAALTWCD